MECDAAGANIYHIIVYGNTFHAFFFSFFYFQLSVYIGEVRAVAIKIDQVCAESKLTFFFNRLCGLQKKKIKQKLSYYLGRNDSALFKVF